MRLPSCLLLVGHAFAWQTQGTTQIVRASHVLAPVQSGRGLRASRVATFHARIGDEQSKQPFIALPPAADRDIAAEASIAASLFRPSSVPLFRPVDETNLDRQQRRVALLTHLASPGTSFQQLACEVVADITSGKRLGTSWAKPLALRTSANATLAESAHRFDPCIGWIESSVPSTIHIFSRLAPAIFVPSAKLEEAPAALALAVRSMTEAHADSGDDSNGYGFLADGHQHSDAAVLHAFVRLLEL